jgi:hypothetical protein
VKTGFTNHASGARPAIAAKTDAAAAPQANVDGSGTGAMV